MNMIFLIGLLALGDASAISRAEVEKLVEETQYPETRDSAYTRILELGDGVLPLLDEIGRAGGSDHAYRALAKFGAKALPWIERLLKEEDRRLREAGAGMVFWEWIVEGFPLLLEAYQREPSRYLREVYFNAAFDILRWRQLQPGPQQEPGPVHVEFLREVLVRGDGFDLSDALEWAAWLGLPETRAGALRALGNPEAEVREKALHALVGVATTEDREYVLAAARSDPVSRSRALAFHVLAANGDPRGREGLLKMLRSGDRDEADAACGSLGALGSDESIPAIRSAFAAGRVSKGTAYRALETLCGTSFPEYPGADVETNVEAWLGARNDESLRSALADPQLRKTWLAGVLGRIADTEHLLAVEPAAELVAAGRPILSELREAAEHESPRVRAVAIHLLGGWKDREAVPVLLKHLRDEGLARFGVRKSRETSVREDCEDMAISTVASKALTAIFGYDPRFSRSRGDWERAEFGQRWCVPRRPAKPWRPWVPERPPGRDWVPFEFSEMTPSEQREFLAEGWLAWIAEHPQGWRPEAGTRR